MEIRDFDAGRRPTPEGAGLGSTGQAHAAARGAPERLGRRETVVLLCAGAAALVLLLGWEVARPSLPVPFELATAARFPGAPSWVVRLPMAAAALGGLLALYTFMSRTTDRATSAYAVAILATMPAWFVHGRMMTGAILPMACSAAVLAGLGTATLGTRFGPRTRAFAIGGALAAAIGSTALVHWGAPNRGLASVVAMPAIAVGLAASLWKDARTPTSATTGKGALVAGLALVAGAAVVAIVRPDGVLADLLLGSRAVVGGPSTFEAPVAALAYGLVPWTPFVPFAIARRPTSAGQLAVMIAAMLAIGAHSALAPRSGPATVVGIASIAAGVAAMLRSLEETRRPAVALVATILAIGWLVAHDIGVAPDRVLVAFGASDAAMPSAHAAASSLAIRSSVWLCMVLATVALIVPRTWLPTGRGLAIVAGGVFAGLVLRMQAYPELLARLSPGAAFDAWAERHRAGEPLGLVGIDQRAVAFAPGTAVVPQSDARAAGLWLAKTPHETSASPRRFLALGAAELPRVNAEYRGVLGRNVPVLAGREGSTLLAASSLSPGERSQSPLDMLVLDAPPEGLRPLDAVLEDRLEAIGWELVDERGRRIDAVPRGSRRARVRVFVRARARAEASNVLAGYCTFLHIEHSPSRFSAEHREASLAAYPMSLWRPGDVIVDDYDVKLPAHFHGGSYRMYWGVGVLPCEDDHRMHVSSGPNDGHDRIAAGILEVR